MLFKLLRDHIREGTLVVRMPDGGEHRFGAGEPLAEWIIKDPRAADRIARDPELELGETYMEGAWDAGEGGLQGLLRVLMSSFGDDTTRGLSRPLRLLAKGLQQTNRIARSRRNVAHHYDLDEWLFRRFLDADMHYSCAYYPRPAMDLEAAQQAKCAHIAGKLLLEPGQRVLDIGCGWGSFALHLAREHGVAVQGLTLSKEQLRVARERAEAQGLADRVQFELQDYREHTGTYDRIVSVGMFEHVGVPHYREYFAQVRDLLAPDGVAMIHTIGRSAPPGNTNAWIRKHIFPGGYTPALSEVSAAIEKERLTTCDVEVWRLHYAETLAHWLDRFSEHREAVRERLGEEFCRMWEFYLASTEGAFRWWDAVVFQIQLAHRNDAVPIARDYLYPASEAVVAN